MSQGLRLSKISWTSGFFHSERMSPLCATRTDVGSYSICADRSLCSEPRRPVRFLVFWLEVESFRAIRLAFSWSSAFQVIPARTNILLQSAQPGARILRTFVSMRKRGDRLRRSLWRVRRAESGGPSIGVDWTPSGWNSSSRASKIVFIELERREIQVKLGRDKNYLPNNI